ncbi:MAG: hypothetical protein NC408_03280 [Candidatus Gastranaerophilales bacterium]|nr:hypothetical protein [Candidatus Gastranaerophilales bacterium]MCM1073193.1 hypothetical protein [Bacteroides sp.]
MKIENINSQSTFKAKLSPALLKGANRCAKNEMQKDFLAKRIKEIEQYGDNSTVIAAVQSNLPISGYRVSLLAFNHKLPERVYSPHEVATPLYIAGNHIYRKTDLSANEYDIVTMITPERVYECEKKLFIDSVRDNKLNPQETLKLCKTFVAADTYKAFQEAAEQLKKNL